MSNRLIKLLDKVIANFRFDAWENTDKIANYLLANGVIAPICKVGDKVYALTKKSIQEYTVYAIEYDEKSVIIKCHSWIAECESLLHKHISYFNNSDFGKTVFLTKEEAEAKMKGGKR